MRYVLVFLTLLPASLALAQTQKPEAVSVVTHIDPMPTGVNPGIAARQLAAETWNEKGSVHFEGMRQDCQRNHVTVVAVRESREAFKAHDAALGSPWDERPHQLIAVK